MEQTKLNRRRFLQRSGLAAGALLAGCAHPRTVDPTRDFAEPGCEELPTPEREPLPEASALTDWQAVREQFDVSPDWVHMAGMLVATHPKPVAEAIDRHRSGLDANPATYLHDRWFYTSSMKQDAEQKVMEAAGKYLGADPANIALTGSTTQGLATVYNGIRFREGQEVLSAQWNHWATRGPLVYRAKSDGVKLRNATLWSAPRDADPDEIVDRLIAEIRPHTRVVAATWVHSVSGVRMPIAAIGEKIRELNEGRSSDEKVLFVVDGVHGFGVEDFEVASLNCDFFCAGAHKWLFGPRGTGIVWGDPDAWDQAVPSVASFSGDVTPGRAFTPGGFHAFEHRWALAEAFEFHRSIGKNRIADRIHMLTKRAIEGLAGMPHVELRTPRRPDLTSGIVTFAVDGVGTEAVLAHLHDRGIIASSTPESRAIPRLSPGLLNDESDVDSTLEAVAALG